MENIFVETPNIFEKFIQTKRPLVGTVPIFRMAAGAFQPGHQHKKQWKKTWTY